MDSVIQAAIVYLLLWFVIRLTGRRALGQLSTFEFVLFLIIGGTVQRALLGQDYSLTNAIIVIATLVAIDVIVSLIERRSAFFSKIVRGVPTILVENGRPLESRQAVQFAVADLYTKLQAGQLLTYRTAWKFDNGTLQRHETFMTKIFCTELGFEAADRCMQFHGGLGTATEMPIERMWRQSRSFMITGGPVEIMRASLAREVFSLYQ